MQDPFGREVDYLRLSVTDRCNLRCGYCMSEKMEFLPRKDLLSIEELCRLADVFIGLGMRKLRITGGEPLVRRDLMLLFKHLSTHLDDGTLDEVTLTTNAVLLEQYAQPLADYGVRRINVSLDTLKPDLFREITRLGDIEPVLQGLEAAKKAGLQVRINAVAMKDVNDVEFNTLVGWAGDNGFDLAFIESMPMGDINDRSSHFMTLDQVREQIEQRWDLELSSYSTAGPARYHTVKETGSRVGFISPFSHNFCESCNRVRLTCTGTLYLCLGQDHAVDLRDLLRNSESDLVLEQAIREAMLMKPKGHDFDANRLDDAEGQIIRFMSTTGG